MLGLCVPDSMPATVFGPGWLSIRGAPRNVEVTRRPKCGSTRMRGLPARENPDLACDLEVLARVDDERSYARAGGGDLGVAVWVRVA